MNPAAKRKQAAYRKRQKRGIAVYKIEIAELELAEALINAGRLSCGQSGDRTCVEHQVAAIVREWCERWR